MKRLLDNEKLIVGFDLGDINSQISFCIAGDNVESLSSIAGGEDYNIPTILCKREGVNQWFYGKEAVKYAEEEKGIMVDHLLELARIGEMIQIDEKPYDPIALLTLFVKRCLGLLAQISSSEKIEAIMFTCENLDGRMLEIIKQLAAGLKLKTEQVFCQSHTESFYNYVIHQPEELWSNQVLLCEYAQDKMKIFRMELNKRTQPRVAFINSEEYDFLSYEPMPMSESLRKDKFERLDSDFLELSKRLVYGQIISSVYLIGGDFSEEWLNNSLRELCRGRRIFQGNNLYCKGACFGMLERVCESEMGKKHVFLGNDKLRANVGMNVYKRGEKSYYALLDAGVNWFEAEKEVELYIQDGNELDLVITPLMSGGVRNEIVTLDDFNNKISRIKLTLRMKDEKTMYVEFTDLGLGEVIGAVGGTKYKEIELY